ncbi:capsid [Mosquito circovirus]|uniref:Capsid n=1 Tax=Mosquito circovirus TaxID=1611039 RepID=A0A0C5BKQ9_9VIRU|nr:capsid [Mosquito circovirus]AJM89739.1 capsid [Mosquito circovirus]AJM89741.1 capsid [Mosquito circovirus]
MAYKRMRRSRKRAPRKRSYRRRFRRRFNTSITRTVLRKFFDTSFSTTDVGYNYLSDNPKGTPGWSYYASSFHHYRVVGLALKFVPKATTAPMETGMVHYDSSLFFARDISPVVWAETGNNLINKALSIPNMKQRTLTRSFSLYFPMRKSSPTTYQATAGGYLSTDDPKTTQLVHMVSEKMSFAIPGRFYLSLYIRFKNKRYTTTPV